jgi:NAD+ synthase
MEVRDITAMVDGYLGSLDEEPSRIRIGNLQARARMAILYDLSARDGRLVLGTSNKTEILLGYTTLWGDNAYAVNPLGDLYKTQVRTLAGAVGLPDRIVAKPPTADLWQDQTDEGDLGFTYADADRILFLTVDARYRPEDLVELGFDEDLVGRITEMVRRNQFKRRLPLWPKVSPRTVGLDFRYLRDWGT